MKRYFFKAIIHFLFFVLVNFQTFAQVPMQEFKKDSTSFQKTLSLLEYSNLFEVKKKVSEKHFSSLYKKTVKEADEALQLGVLSVTQKTQTPSGGTKHDYLSIGPYWWPDPTKADGLPWIRRDGEINPLTRENTTDERTKNTMFHSTNNLAMAYFFSEDKKYATKAVELLKGWFLYEETKMNPNLNFAQGIPGVNTGRGIGIIEFAGITNVITAIEILELQKQMDAATSAGLRLWFSDYLHWLQTSENGIFENNTKNNHGTWYDVQVVSILLFLDRKDEAKQVLETVKTKRIATQIESNGAQPHELERTKALSYATMNLKGFTQLAILGKKVEVDLWNYKCKEGASIVNAFAFLQPYAQGKKEWDYKQITDKEKAIKVLKELFLMAGSQFNVLDYCQIGMKDVKNASSLLYNCN